MKLMIVDDSTMIRSSLSAFISRMGIEIVGTAANGQAAVELFRTTMPDVVTLDITMPEMDGLTAMKHMLAIKPDVKILIISALNSKDMMVQAINDGACGYITKPYTADRLQEEFAKITGA